MKPRRVILLALVSTMLPAPTFADPPCHGDCVCDFDDGSNTGTPDGACIFPDDLVYYLALFAAGAPCADIDDGQFFGLPDGGVTIDDLLYFLFRFECG